MWLDAKEANSIPILDVARIVVPRFQDKGRLSTGECCMHIDNKLGNLRFKIEKNYAHCFTCGRTWWPVSLVMDFMKMDFKEALEFLYRYFPSYFTVELTKEKKKKPKWNGLTNQEYKFLGIAIQQHLGNTAMNIRDFANIFPEEHDALLTAKIQEKKKEIDRLNKFLIGKIDNEELNRCRLKIEKKIENLLNKGLKSKNKETNYKKIVSF